MKIYTQRNISLTQKKNEDFMYGYKLQLIVLEARCMMEFFHHFLVEFLFYREHSYSIGYNKVKRLENDFNRSRIHQEIRISRLPLIGSPSPQTSKKYHYGVIGRHSP